MKKIFKSLLILLLCFGFVGCKKDYTFEVKLGLDDKELVVGDALDLNNASIDVTQSEETDEYLDYESKINLDDDYFDYDEESNIATAKKSGETKIWLTYTKEDKVVESNKIKLNIKEANVVSISATYNGSTIAGSTIDNHSMITVEGVTDTNKTINISDWEVVNPSALVEEETTTYQIKYKELSCDLSITCTTPKPMSVEQSNAVDTAKSYLRTSSFSRKGLIEQLEYEGYSNEAATFAVDKVNPDWNEQAKKSAQSYMKVSSFSKSGLINQLLYEGFTQEQAEIGVSAVGY